MRTGAVHIVRPGWNDGVSERVLGDEFGLPSLFSTWVPEPMTKAALRAAGIDARSIRVTHSAANAPVPTETGPVLDLRQLATLR